MFDEWNLIFNLILIIKIVYDWTGKIGGGGVAKINLKYPQWYFDVRNLSFYFGHKGDLSSNFIMHSIYQDAEGWASKEGWGWPIFVIRAKFDRMVHSNFAKIVSLDRGGRGGGYRNTPPLIRPPF